ncbi:probable RNA-binding protein 18 [Mizuhopecten yessoensis]|uniref:Probable RNA-binding protein 18 n=1 Tax=Mizuhopecten yessoensis TaxID=6573 RepID=A0A210R551_MIZYE|nr:probable RNA-binding protein 18 [Mizuhopecten yessoensis]OWF56095.1 RNA-binding protein 18 [Mizuhopecten yessoensis]
MAFGGLSTVQDKITVPNDPYSDATDDCRVWLGNLDSRLTEFSLLKVLQKYGSLKRFDFLLHKSGPDVGKPRGYCFVSYQHRKDAERAVKGLNGKQALSKRMIVKWAHAEKHEVEPVTRLSVKKDPVTFVTKEDNHSPESTIKAIEEKLRNMEETRDDFTMSTKPAALPGTNQLSAIHQHAKQVTTRKPRSHHQPYTNNRHGRRR